MAPSEVVAVFADGGVLRRNPSPLGGMWAYCHTDARGLMVASRAGVIVPSGAPTLGLAEPMGGAEVTNNQTEFLAVLTGLEALPDGWIGHVFTDSQVTITRWTAEPADGLVPKGIPLAWWDRKRAVLRRLGGLSWHRLDGHPTREQLRTGIGKRGGTVSVHQVWCDTACTEVGRDYLKRKGLIESGRRLAA